ncbi:uncharacterized protein LOC18992589 [Eutrema salsugineum]|uniref:uncharacterized protein LOC18992589 n=1 Tax=Eutrema salsugineum TaxID=72664 RepID=UPI000CED0596|nr:uncharacterized protein LOC18992589 [Eutrema salsugineum]XP_024008607.1 uncharacterized protein LOC18992589 [Eutrema salsugineum]
MTNSSEKSFPLSAKDYELFEEIGDGINRGRCIVRDEIVAVKILDLEKCSSNVETITKEVHTLSLNEHCSFLDGSKFWIVLPYLHGQGHAHQDVKAGDILAGSNETVKLGDFGLSASQLPPPLGEHVDIPSGAKNPTCEDELLERNFASDNSGKVKNDEAVASWIQNPLSNDAAQILPVLQNLLHDNEMQRERLIGLIQLYDPTPVNINPMMNTEGGQISTERDLTSEVHFLEQSVKKLEEQVENQKTVNAQLEVQLLDEEQ